MTLSQSKSVLLIYMIRCLSAIELVRREVFTHQKRHGVAGEHVVEADHRSDRALPDSEPIRDAETSWRSDGILCEVADVRVADNGLGWRSLQFRNAGLWQQHEGKMKCNEDASLCSHKSTAPDTFPPKSAAECPTCPCTSTLPIEDYWAKYQNPMLLQLREHCKRRKEYNVIVVGMGTGGNVQAIVRNCEVGTVSVIEKSQEVYEAAKYFFGFSAMTVEKGVQVLAPYDGTDGLLKLLHDHGNHKFDAVVVDCMVQGVIPSGCKSAEFYTALARNLKPGGLVFQWTWPADQGLAQSRLSRSLRSAVRMTHWWATSKEAENPPSLIMLSGMSDDAESARAHAFVSGKVQGVSYRSNTVKQATARGLVGWVRNLSDGRVELVAEGLKSQVDSLLEWCHTGPSKAMVDDVSVTWEKVEGQAKAFVKARDA